VETALTDPASPATPPTTRPAWGDLVAGVSVALVLIPQSLAYAELAGMPAYYGLYAACLPPIAAAFFASSPYLQTGPGAMTSLLTFGALAPLATRGGPEYIGLAALLALVVGVVRLGIGTVRLGWIAYLMSHPMLIGFMAAAALLIAASQLPTALGAVAPDGGLLGRAYWAVIHVGGWRWPDVALATVTVILVFGGRRMHPLFPGVFVAVLIGLACGILGGYAGSTIGAIPATLPPLAVALDWSALPSLVVPGSVIALVGFAEAAAISRTFAMQERSPWSPNREFISQGIANVASAFSSGFPVGGSFARSSVNRLAGARTRWSGAVAGLAVLAFLPVANTISHLPRPILAGIVIAAVIRLMDPRPLLKLLRHSYPQATIAWATFALTLALAPRIDRAVVIGVALTVVIHLWRELPVLVKSQFADGVLHIEPQGVLFFASAPGLNHALVKLLAAHPDAERMVIDLSHLGRVDYPGALALQQVVGDAQAAGLAVSVVQVPGHARRILGAVFGMDSPLLQD
jgi:SulP family sulfate permease